MPFSASISLRNFRILTHRRPDFAFILTILFPKKQTPSRNNFCEHPYKRDWLTGCGYMSCSHTFSSPMVGGETSACFSCCIPVMWWNKHRMLIIWFRPRNMLSWVEKQRKQKLDGTQERAEWQWLVTPLADSLVGPNHLRYTFIQSSNIRKSVKCNETN